MKNAKKASASNGAVQPADTEPTEAEKKKKRVFRPVIMISCLALGLLFLCAGLWYSGIAKEFFHGSPSKVAGPVFLPVPEIITNLNGKNGEDSYAKLKVTLELPDADAAKKANMNMPRLVDMFEGYLRAMHPSELHGASGTYRLREALISRARIAMAPTVVQDVLFEELIVQ